MEFPLECHFRVIAEDSKDLQRSIETVLLGLGVSEPVERSNMSSTGKYIAYGVSTTVQSRAAMDRIDASLRAIDGVRMVL